MSLYFVQKLLYQLNRDEKLRELFETDVDKVISNYELSGEEIDAIKKSDIGFLYVLGVNGQLLMHFAAFRGLAWDEYLQAMRDGVDIYGPVRAGIYAMTDY